MTEINQVPRGPKMANVQQNDDLCDNSLKVSGVAIAHTPRNYHKYPGSKYALPHDDLERQRLLLQHNTLNNLFEDRFVLAPVSLDHNDKVLDIGTGSGLWIMDLATGINPSVPIIGVDIEPRLFPASVPKNIEFRVESVTSLPSEWTETFSLVHQRCLILALQVHQWSQAIHEIFRVLRPGGWVQLTEVAFWPEGKYPRRPCMEKLVAIFRRVTEARNLNADCAYDIPKILEEAGFVDIQSEARMQCMGKWAGDIGVANAKNSIGVLGGIKTPVLEAGGFGYVTSEAEYDELLDGLAKEWDEIPGIEWEIIITWARKPSA
ncbi:S-adenosyl-L-methionine-dependent methyltransferase [Mycena sanguinolenta]|uniref:S-adenosyl-L-methionine-dependent methyltransferase n=1 Tax=Mycena sanguinolenta TaxID=230812 RepID=A0A8H7D9E1_9AGAR|nr:S-adenosyl-L-methionine-dependent methyltransferase [Mycena sanguinolenta]